MKTSKFKLQTSNFKLFLVLCLTLLFGSRLNAQLVFDNSQLIWVLTQSNFPSSYNTIEIRSGTTVWVFNSSIKMKTNGKITVEKGSQIVFNDCIISHENDFATNFNNTNEYFWKGIECLGDGTTQQDCSKATYLGNVGVPSYYGNLGFVSIYQSTVRFAEEAVVSGKFSDFLKGIKTNSGGIIYALLSTFENNKISIGIAPYNGIVRCGAIEGNTFKASFNGPNKNNLYGSQQLSYARARANKNFFIYINGCQYGKYSNTCNTSTMDYPEIDGNTFSSNQSNNIFWGIVCRDSKIESMGANTFTNLELGYDFRSSIAYPINGDPNSPLQQDVFRECRYGIDIVGYQSGLIRSEDFELLNAKTNSKGQFFTNTFGINSLGTPLFVENSSFKSSDFYLNSTGTPKFRGLTINDGGTLFQRIRQNNFTSNLYAASFLNKNKNLYYWCNSFIETEWDVLQSGQIFNVNQSLPNKVCNNLYTNNFGIPHPTTNAHGNLPPNGPSVAYQYRWATGMAPSTKPIYNNLLTFVGGTTRENCAPPESAIPEKDKYGYFNDLFESESDQEIKNFYRGNMDWYSLGIVDSLFLEDSLAAASFVHQDLSIHSIKLLIGLHLLNREFASANSELNWMQSNFSGNQEAIDFYNYYSIMSSIESSSNNIATFQTYKNTLINIKNSQSLAKYLCKNYIENYDLLMDTCLDCIDTLDLYPYVFEVSKDENGIPITTIGAQDLVDFTYGPNPVLGLLSCNLKNLELNSQNYRIEVLNNQLNEIVTHIVNNLGSMNTIQFDLDFTSLPSGTYYLLLKKTDGLVIRSEIIIK